MLGKQWPAPTNEAIGGDVSLTRERLSNKCIKIVVKNFASYPVHENIPARSNPSISTFITVMYQVYARNYREALYGSGRKDCCRICF